MAPIVSQADDGRKVVNRRSLLAFCLVAPLVAFASWAIFGKLLTGDWTWLWGVGIAHSILGPSITLSAMLHAPINRLPRFPRQ